MSRLPALAVLTLIHSLVAPRLEPLVNLTLGLPRIAFLTPLALAGLGLGGALLGALGGWLARGGREA